MSLLPDRLPPRLQQQLTFLLEIDRLKGVLRQSRLLHEDRRENSAEHSWHLALILQHWFPSVDHAFWSRLSMPDIYTFTLRDEGPPELARPWEAGSRFLPVSGAGKDA
jgi:hypothetical protein